MSAPRRMKIRRLDEFSVVDRPANPLARIVMSKRLVEKQMPEPQDKTEALGLLRKIADAFGFARELATDDKFAKRVKEMPDGKWHAFDEDGKPIGMFDSEDEARAAAYGKGDKETNKMADETVTKADVEKMQKALEDLTKRAEQAEADAKAHADKVAKLETERRTAEFTKRAETYAPLPIKSAPEFGAILMKVADVLTAEENAELDKVLVAGKEAMRKALTEIGSDAPADGTAAAEVAKAVEELRKQNPKLTEQAARGQVFKSNPELRRKVEAEQAPAGR